MKYLDLDSVCLRCWWWFVGLKLKSSIFGNQSPPLSLKEGCCVKALNLNDAAEFRIFNCGGQWILRSLLKDGLDHTIFLDKSIYVQQRESWGEAHTKFWGCKLSWWWEIPCSFLPQGVTRRGLSYVFVLLAKVTLCNIISIIKCIIPIRAYVTVNWIIGRFEHV